MITNKDISIDSENGKITLNGNKYDLGTQGEIDTAVKDVYSVMGQNGAKNLIPYPYPNMSTTVRGITWSDNGDGGIVGNGTGTEASAQPYCDLNGNARDLLLKANTWYTLTCKRTSPFAIGANIYFLDPTTMQQTTITFDVIYGDSAQTTNTKNNVFMYNAGVVSEEVKFKLSQDMYAQVQVRYKAGTNVTVSNDVQYPMLRLAADTDDTYQPYAMTNKQLTEQVAEVKGTIGDITQTGITGASVAAQLEAVGDQLEELTATTLIAIDISSYNSETNRYTAPTNGYVRMELRNANQYFYLMVNGTSMLGGEGHSVTNANDYLSVFVKKGMNIYYSGTVQTAIFYSLT